MVPIKKFILAQEKGKLREIGLAKKAAKYTIIGQDLYKRGYSTPLLNCVTKDQGDYVLKELHEGICGYHSGARAMTTQILRARFYWPTIREDCKKFFQKCKKCQEFGSLKHLRSHELQGIHALWSFSKWGKDIEGPFLPS